MHCRSKPIPSINHRLALISHSINELVSELLNSRVWELLSVALRYFLELLDELKQLQAVLVYIRLWSFIIYNIQG